MITENVILKAHKQGWPFRNEDEPRVPVNVCNHCGEEDDPETTAHWPEDLDGDLICFECDHVDIRVPVTIVFDMRIDRVPRRRVKEAIEALEDVFLRAEIEQTICEKYEGKGEVAYGSRWNPVTAALDEVTIRDSELKGSFYPWKEEVDEAKLQEAMKATEHLEPVVV